MAHYLIQLSHTTDSWAAQLAAPHDRRDVVRPLFEPLGKAPPVVHGTRQNRSLSGRYIVPRAPIAPPSHTAAPHLRYGEARLGASPGR